MGDGRLLREGLLDPTNTGAGVRTDTGYRSERNETSLQRRGFVSHIHRHRPPGRPLPAHIRRGNARRSRDRAPVEHVLALPKQATGLALRTIGLARARTRVGMANLAYNLRRLVPIQGRVTDRRCIAGPVCPNRRNGGKNPRRRGNLRPRQPLPAVKRRRRQTTASESGLVEVRVCLLDTRCRPCVRTEGNRNRCRQ